MDIVISYLNFNSQYHNEYRFAVKLISLVITSNFFFIRSCLKNANIANFVYYGKTWIRVRILLKLNIALFRGWRETPQIHF